MSRPQYEPAEKKTDMEEQGAFPKAPRERENLPPVKKGQKTQGEYKEVVRMHREKIKKVKAQPELNLAVGIKDNKKLKKK